MHFRKIQNYGDKDLKLFFLHRLFVGSNSLVSLYHFTWKMANKSPNISIYAKPQTQRLSDKLLQMSFEPYIFSELLEKALCKGNRLVYRGARIFDLTVTSIDVIGPQKLATEELAIHYI